MTASGRAVVPSDNRRSTEADPSPCRSAAPVAAELPQRSCGNWPAIEPARAAQPLADPQILRRVLDGIRQL